MNTMKFLTTLLLITVCFGFVSCKDKDEELSLLVGSWRSVEESFHLIKDDTIVVVHAELQGDSLKYIVDSLEYNGEKKYHREDITFYSNGTYEDVLVSEQHGDTIEHGTYIHKENQLLFQPANEEPSVHVILELTSDRLILYVYDKYIGRDQSAYEACDKILYQKIR
jgi:hypothetical protein